MRERERKNNREHREEQYPTPGIPAENSVRAREAAERFLQAGDDAINQALSASSEEFLAANRQEGGQ